MTIGKVLWKRFQSFVFCSVVAMVFVIAYGVQLWANRSIRNLSEDSLVLESRSYGDDCITRQDLENRFSFSQYFLPGESYHAHYKDQQVTVFKTVFSGGDLANIPMYTTDLTVAEKDDPLNAHDQFGCFHTLTNAIEKELWHDP